MLEDLSQHILDIAENSLNARASEIRITLSEDTVSGWLILEIEDNGSGMDDETLIRV
ncbi:MAG: ATP-binding protein, partial [Synergistales bacterium]|nr:ATP-binding protein [Synergistales bacterium]